MKLLQKSEKKIVKKFQKIKADKKSENPNLMGTHSGVLESLVAQ